MRPVTRASSGRSGTLCHLEGQVAVDMRVVWPQDVKKMLLKQARMVYWKRWAANHEYEELEGGVWLELIQAMAKEDERILDGRTPKCGEEAGCGRRMGAEKIVRHWLVGRKECGGSYKEEVTEKDGLHLCPSCREVRNQIPAELGKRDQRAKTLKDNWKWQRGITAYPLRESNWRKNHLTVPR